jgi:hypothetical protein
MITLTRVKGLSHKNVAEKGPEYPTRMDRLSDSRAHDLFCTQDRRKEFAEAAEQSAKLLKRAEKKTKPAR